MARLGFNDDPRDRYNQSAFDSNYRLGVQALHDTLGCDWWRPAGGLHIDGIPNVDQSAPNYATGYAQWRLDAMAQYANYVVSRGQKLVIVMGGLAFLNSTNTRAIGTAAEWGLDNLCYWAYRYVPPSVWSVRWEWNKTAIHLWLQALRDAGAANPYDYLEGSLINEPHNYVVPSTPYTVTVTVASTAGVDNKITVSDADAAKVSVGDYLTVRGPTKYQSFRVASKASVGGGNTALTGSTNSTEKWSDGVSTQNTCLYNIGVSEVAQQCVYPAGNQNSLPTHLYDEMEYELAALKATFPHLFVWGPTIAGGNRTKMQHWHDQSGRNWDLVDGVSFNYYSNDPVNENGLSYGVDPGPATFWAVYNLGLGQVLDTIKAFTAYDLASKPIGLFETGVRASDWGGGSSVPYEELKHAAYTEAFINGFRAVRSELTHVALWAMGRGGSTAPTNSTWDLATGPTGNESTKATLYTRGAQAQLTTKVAGSEFANAGSGGAGPSGEPPVTPL